MPDSFKGIQETVSIAIKDIPRGYMILHDYSDAYFGTSEYQYTEMADGDGFPTFIEELRS